MPLKPHEVILRQLKAHPKTGDVVRVLLGISSKNMKGLSRVFEPEKLDIRQEYSWHLGLDEYSKAKLPKINKKLSTVKGIWGNDGGISTIINQKAYTAKIETAIDKILSSPTQNSPLVPITILMPNVVQMDGDNLEGTESKWKFTQILHDTCGDKLGTGDLFNKPEFLYGARILSVFNSLGIAGVKRSERNKSDFFSHLVQSTSLHSQFEYLGSKAVHKWKKLQKQLDTLDKKVRRLSEKVDKNYEIIEQAIKSTSGKVVKARAEIEEYTRLIKQLTNEQIPIDEELESIKLEAQNLGSDFYFAIPQSIYGSLSVNIKDSERLIALPSLRAKHLENFQVSGVNTKDGEVTKWSLKRMRYVLSYLFPMTSGHAITLWIQPEANERTVNRDNVIKSPTLILPSAWMMLMNDIKQHSPKEGTINYDEFEGKSETELKGVYKSALYGDFWAKRRDLLRVIPEITGTTMSAD